MPSRKRRLSKTGVAFRVRLNFYILQKATDIFIDQSLTSNTLCLHKRRLAYCNIVFLHFKFRGLHMINSILPDARFAHLFFQHDQRLGNKLHLEWSFHMERNLTTLGTTRSRLECDILCVTIPICSRVWYNGTDKACYSVTWFML